MLIVLTNIKREMLPTPPPPPCTTHSGLDDHSSACPKVTRSRQGDQVLTCSHFVDILYFLQQLCRYGTILAYLLLFRNSLCCHLFFFLEGTCMKYPFKHEGGTHDGGLQNAILAQQAKGNPFKVSHNRETSQPVHTRVHKKCSCHQS